MSKLYQTYMSLKIQNSEQLYLFKSGIFYIFLDEDAKIMSRLLNLKLTNLNSIIVKCGFPISKLDKYTKIIERANYSFKIIDIANNISFLPSEYKVNIDINKLLTKIASINIYNLSISNAYDFIDEISKESKRILQSNNFAAKIIGNDLYEEKE